ncbi:MAG: hypothetical protein ACLFUW_04980 [Bacteroidales bacterium]
MKTTMNLSNTFWVIMTIAVLFSFSSCKQASKEEKGEKQEKSEQMSKKEIREDVEEVVYPIPTSIEITEKLNKTGASFIIGISNDAENVDQYVTEDKQALNLGVYSADLSYTSTYNMKQYTMNYMDANRKLVRELGITGAFTSDFHDQVKENFDNKDKLVELISNSFYDTYEHMHDKGKEELAMMVVAGSWIEAMYITTHISENTYHNKEIVKLIADQEKTLNKLLEVLEPFKENGAINKIIDDLDPIKEIYDNKPEDGFKEKQVLSIQEKIASVRNDVIV